MSEAGWREAFRTCRRRAGSLADVSRTSGVAMSTLHKIERRKDYDPGVGTLMQIIEQGFQMTAVEFFELAASNGPGPELDALRRESERAMDAVMAGHPASAGDGSPDVWQHDVLEAITILARALRKGGHA